MEELYAKSSENYYAHKNKFLEIQRANSDLAYRVEKLRSNNQAQSALKGPQVVFMFRDTSEP